ncbi:MAG: ribosome maturation factor RimP [Actinomycetota bacterium]
MGGRAGRGSQVVLEERVRSIVEPVLARHDAELVELSVRRGRTQLVRVVADREGGIDLDTCALVSKELSRMLDADDPIAGRYTLEITSPGLGRPLRTPADFRRVLGRRVRIVLAQSQHEGTLEEVWDDQVRLTTERGPVEVPLADVTNAKVVLPW